MLGFFFTTVGDVATRGEGPLEQLRDEETYVMTHINPVSLVQDALGLADFSCATAFIGQCLAHHFLVERVPPDGVVQSGAERVRPRRKSVSSKNARASRAAASRF